jgi:hypothetical protein
VVSPQKVESLSRFSNIVERAYDDFAQKCGGGDIAALYGFEITQLRRREIVIQGEHIERGLLAAAVEVHQMSKSLLF